MLQQDLDTVGCELECGFKGSDGNWLDTLAVLNGGLTGDVPFEAATSDMALPSLEVITGVCRSEAEIRASLDRMFSRLPQGTRPVFETKPFGDTVELARKSRVKAVSDALACEHLQGCKGVPTVAPHCSTQFHIGVPDVMSDEGVLLGNFLNNISPFARLRVIDLFGVKGAEGHLKIWYGWAMKERLPSPRWFCSGADLDECIRDIPKLVTLQNGEWTRMTSFKRSRIDDPESMGTIWWIVRPRACFNTYEWRPFPSLAPRFAAELGGQVLTISRHFREFVSGKRIVNDPGSRFVRDLYSHMARFSSLVPSEPLSEHEWWRLFAR